MSFNAPSLSPSFGTRISDYVVRCNDQPVTVKAHASSGWELAVGDHPFRSGDFSVSVSLGAGRAFTVTARGGATSDVYRYHVRCLPSDFPRYSFIRYGPVSPEFFAVDQARGGSSARYAIIFDDHGAPVWWYRIPAWGTRVLANGNLLWFDRSSSPGRWTIRHLDGTFVRSLLGFRRQANSHDLQILPNGGYLLGAYVTEHHVDTSAYGGSSDASVINAELQQVGPGGGLLWDWKSQHHISLGETPKHRWPFVINSTTPQGYDILHWNSIEPDGKFVIASFRHLDAVYKIRKRDGYVVWKLGGTKTPKSLTVKGDPHGYTLGAQHDARLLPDGTLTVFDNRTNVSPSTPEAVRFRIDENQRTATLLKSITDPAVSGSHCCGSARRFANGDWLIDWGPSTVQSSNGIGGYEPDGARTFRLTFNSNFSYRAEPVPAGAVTARDLRQAMNARLAAHAR